MECFGGICRIMEVEDENGRKKRMAVLAIDKCEVSNLQSYNGNPLFIDGTNVPNRLHWELTMITLVDRHLGIQPGGVMFSLYTNVEVYHWFLQQLIDILGEKKMTIITDEDLAMGSCIDKHNSTCTPENRITHILCSWHKSKDFEKKMSSCNLTNDEKENIRSLWKRICYSAKKEVVEKSIETKTNMLLSKEGGC